MHKDEDFVLREGEYNRVHILDEVYLILLRLMPGNKRVNFPHPDPVVCACIM